MTYPHIEDNSLPIMLLSFHFPPVIVFPFDVFNESFIAHELWKFEEPNLYCKTLHLERARCAHAKSKCAI